jgi:hypothetical protein
MHEVAVISDRWKICTFRDLLLLPFFLDRIAGDANIVVVLERQLNSFAKCNLAPRRRRIARYLGRRNAGEKGCRG